MESSNREEAKRFFLAAKLAFSSGDREKAQRFVEKSLRLCYSQEAQDFLDANISSEQISSQAAKNYTNEQCNAVQRVLHHKDYYNILDVSRGASTADIRKQYKKLALVLHPDKNSAPQSDEAFKAVSNAYSILSDETYRNHYDRYGEDGLRPSAPAQPDLSPEELFQKIFRERYYTFTYNGSSFAHSGSGQTSDHHQPDAEDKIHINYCRVCPIVLVVIISMIGLYLYPEESIPFSLYKNREYSVRRATDDFGIPYFVKNNFKYKDQNMKQEVEKNVLAEYIWQLRIICETHHNKDYQSRACMKLREMASYIRKHHI